MAGRAFHMCCVSDAIHGIAYHLAYYPDWDPAGLREHGAINGEEVEDLLDARGGAPSKCAGMPRRTCQRHAGERLNLWGQGTCPPAG